MSRTRTPRRRTGPIVVGAIALLILIGLVWYFLPLNYDLNTRLETYDVVGYFETDLSPSEGIGEFVISLAEARILGEDAGGLRRAGFNIARSSAFPELVNGWLIYEPGETLPAIIGVVKFGRSVRALKAVHRIALPAVLFDAPSRSERVGAYRLRAIAEGESATPVSAYAFIGDYFVFSTSRAALSSLLHALDSGSMEVQPDVAAALDGIDAPIRALLTNESNRLTSMVRGVEERVAFAALPSADALSTITASFQIEAGEPETYQLVSNTRFSYNDSSRAREVFSDARFLYGALRRVARAQEIELRGEVTDVDSVVQLTLTAGGLENLLTPPPEEEGDEADGDA